MITRFTADENKRIIREVAMANGENPCLLLAMCTVESNFNNVARSPSGTYVGLFQLGNGSGGVKGDDRYNPYKNTEGAINQMRTNKKTVQSLIGKWEDWMAYLAHQQGATGFSHSYLNQNVAFTQAKYYKNMNGQSKLKSCPSYPYKTTGDFINCWKQRIVGLMNSCSENGDIEQSNDIKYYTQDPALQDSFGLMLFGLGVYLAFFNKKTKIF